MENTWDPTGILYPYVEYLRFVKNVTTGNFNRIKKKIFEPEKCTTENVFDPSFFKAQKNFKELNCIDFKKHNMTMGGFLDGHFIDYFRIKVYACENDNRNGKCSSLNNLKKLFITENRLYFEAIYPDFYFDPQNLLDPLKYQYISNINQLSNNLIKKDRAYFKKIELEDDQNLIIEDFKKQNQTALSHKSQDFLFRLDDDYLDKSLSSELYTYTVYFGKNGNKYIRKYMKLQHLAASVGGFMQLVLTMGKILSSQYNSYQRNITLFNEIFQFQEEESLQFDKKSTKTSREKTGIMPKGKIINLFL